MTDPGTDALSPLAARILRAVPDAYRQLVVRGPTPPAAGELLGGVRPEQLLGEPPHSPAHAAAMLAGLWLWHDALGECHSIAQQSPPIPPAPARQARGAGLEVLQGVSPGGREVEAGGAAQRLRDAADSLNFWHAILHRREGDFSNAKYWYARCRGHPVWQALGPNANAIVNPMPADKLLLRVVANGWSPEAFVDLVEHLSDRPDDPRTPAAVALQRLEWRMLFDHCTRLAAGQ